MRSRGFTLVEMLVVIAIIGSLVALLMPGINMAREAGRRNACKNNLKQIGIAAQSHVEAYKFFPSSGWGRTWVGDPDMGYGRKQPGSWIYNLLVYLDQKAIHDMDRTAYANTSDPAQREKNKQNQLWSMRTYPIAVFNCPSRRKSVAYPAASGSELPINAMPSNPPTNAQLYSPSTGKSDYAGNLGAARWFSGDANATCPSTYPINCAWPIGQTVQAASDWQGRMGTDSRIGKPVYTNFDGVTGMLSEVSPASIRDGLSRTFFAGEKYMNVYNYMNGNDSGDNNSMYNGHDIDVLRLCGNRASNKQYPPVNDQRVDSVAGVDPQYRFGSAHSQMVHFVMCDGTVNSIGTSIDPMIFEHLGNRADNAGDGDLPF